MRLAYAFLNISGFIFSFLSSLAIATLISAQSLIGALTAAGASEFARRIQADPSALAIYTSPSVGTVFAVADTWYRKGATNVRRQSSGEEAQKAAIQTCKDVEKLPSLDDQVTVTTGGNKIVGEEQAVSAQSKLRRTLHNGTVPVTPLRISSGLGLKSNILLGDIHYDGGLLHIVDR